ncbi:hypothetical protein [Dyella choica]|uniref:TonB C-terminal domain-containing protein n=1 Tax=Dyella choica TaxID=1927959 RepID=A0A3S0RIT6_9GAMM|nr:hypothetical protein [Dyella choica]RUL72688.1 hypothetical protein EKH80_16760 [Dyella choica]
MYTCMRVTALLLLALPALAGAQTMRDVSRISGSIYSTVISPAPLSRPPPVAIAQPLLEPQDVHAVCLASQQYADRCPAHANMAFCDVDSIGLRNCLSHYAGSLVKQPEGAKRTLSFVVRDARGALSTVTVLATTDQSDEEIARAASMERPGTRIVGMRVSEADSLEAAALRLP